MVQSYLNTNVLKILNLDDPYLNNFQKIIINKGLSQLV
jgi:hypothetical protein